MPSRARFDFAKRLLRGAGVLAGLLLASAGASGAPIRLAWDPVVAPLLSGYAVYVGSLPGRYDVRYVVGDVTSWEVAELEEGSRYHFAVTAYDVFFRESDFSNEVVATIPYGVPVADFQASATSGTAPLALNFTASVQGAATGFLWDFGDGSTSGSRNPAHVYETPGTYTVSLTVTGPGGSATATRAGYVRVVAAASGGGALVAALSSTPGSVDLTAAGSIDWVHWPAGTRKAGVAGQISGVSLVGRGALAASANETVALRWSDGAPAISGSSSQGLFVAGTGRGLAITVPADPVARTLTVYVGATQAHGRLVARLSDGSAPDYVNVPVRKLGAKWNGVYTLTYRAASAGQTLRVEWTQARGTAAAGGPVPGVSLQAAALAPAAPRD
jgi:PKD repeat protein